MHSYYLYQSPALRKFYSDFINSFDSYKYEHYPTYTLERTLKQRINILISEESKKMGSKIARAALYEHLMTRLECFNKYMMISGHTLDNVFYPLQSGHNRHIEICLKSRPLEARLRNTLYLHSIFNGKEIISGELAIEQRLTIATPGSVFS